MARSQHNLSHDGLLSKCFLYTWNQYPATRYAVFHPVNELKKHPADTKRDHIMRLTLAKAIGVVPGVLDLICYWKGVQYCFDVKIDNDRFSNDQKAFIAQVELQGGKCYEIREFSEFKLIFDQIMQQK